MKLGIAINAFDGIELMERAIRSYRNEAYYIVIITQDTSNFGLYDNTSLIEAKRLKELKLIDDIIEYTPLNVKAQQNEVNKRNLGLVACKSAGCTHHMTVDVDEFYISAELQAAKEMMETDKYDVSVCKMITYYKSGEFIVDPPEEYYVPMISKIDHRIYDLKVRIPYLTDPTRRLQSSKILEFKRTEIQMHHMSFVRKDIRKKLSNASAGINVRDRIDRIVECYNDWIPGKRALWNGNSDKFFNLKRVNNQFNIGIDGNIIL
jgi:hypothetical protein